MGGCVRIGTSGWRYPEWRGDFYPRGLPQRSELSYAAQRLDSIEINGSFYSLQHPDSYQSWYEETPPGFVFAIKGGRYITRFAVWLPPDRAALCLAAVANTAGSMGLASRAEEVVDSSATKST